MKKIIFGLLVLVTFNLTAQKRSGAGITSAATVDSTIVKKRTPKWGKYISVGLSVSSGNDYGDNANIKAFKDASYPTIEVGVTRENIALGLVVGRGDFAPAKTSGVDEYKKYYWEIKAAPTFPLGVVTASLIFGTGCYFGDGKGMMIEYGTGISYTDGKVSYGVLYSNWDGIDYITPSLTYSF